MPKTVEEPGSVGAAQNQAAFFHFLTGIALFLQRSHQGLPAPLRIPQAEFCDALRPNPATDQVSARLTTGGTGQAPHKVMRRKLVNILGARPLFGGAELPRSSCAPFP